MTIKAIHNNDELKAAFQRLEVIFQADEGTPEAAKYRKSSTANVR